jgi:hypothetical protein
MLLQDMNSSLNKLTLPVAVLAVDAWTAMVYICVHLQCQHCRLTFHSRWLRLATDTLRGSGTTPK